MRIEDRFVVAAPRERVWIAIKDPAVVAPCIPGCLGVEVISPTLYKAKIRVQVGPIKADFNVDGQVDVDDLGILANNFTTHTRAVERVQDTICVRLASLRLK